MIGIIEIMSGKYLTVIFLGLLGGLAKYLWRVRKGSIFSYKTLMIDLFISGFTAVVLVSLGIYINFINPNTDNIIFMSAISGYAGVKLLDILEKIAIEKTKKIGEKFNIDLNDEKDNVEKDDGGAK